MGKTRKPVQRASGEATTDRIARDETIAESYSSKPSPALAGSGWADRPEGR